MTKLIGILMMLGLMGAFIGCGEDTSMGPISEQIQRWDNGNIRRDFQFYRKGNKEIKHGYYKSYLKDGSLHSSTNFVHGKVEGKSRYYNADGTVFRFECFQNGVQVDNSVCR